MVLLQRGLSGDAFLGRERAARAEPAAGWKLEQRRHHAGNFRQPVAPAIGTVGLD
jgi:hypothetical protein